MLFYLFGVEGYTIPDLFLLGRMKKPAVYPNRCVGLRAKCFAQRLDTVTPIHSSLPPPWGAGLDHRRNARLDRVGQGRPDGYDSCQVRIETVGTLVVGVRGVAASIA
jgi:hypothetical protein